MTLSPEAVLRHTARLTPRYTSYPTAPHFHPGVGPESYRNWLSTLPSDASLSLYMHVPFCDTLCWFCGCHTKITRRYEPIAEYLEALLREIAAVADAAPKAARVAHMHWGGGSPTILEPKDILRLAGAARAAFRFAPDAEFAVEVDPRGMTEEAVKALAASGLTRVSLGVQDFDPKVQEKINRIQTFEETKHVVQLFRNAGVRSLNIDAIYGLPGQHEAELLRTLDLALELKPDRIALFGYAHVPWMKTHQSQINEAELAGVVERYHLAEAAGERLTRAGFERIGVDHFALPSDTLAAAARQHRVQRNFQGYTVDPADALLGFGASAIGRLPQGYVQNEPAIKRYQRSVEAGDFATARGVAFSEEDCVRGGIIERLMCDMTFSSRTIAGLPAELARGALACAAQALAEDRDGFLRQTPDGFVVTELGRPFVRTIAARFDAYLARQEGRHSLAV
jgi:oxygen-independent coproporphyrinogen-3 oxidase